MGALPKNVFTQMFLPINAAQNHSDVMWLPVDTYANQGSGALGAGVGGNIKKYDVLKLVSGKLQQAIQFNTANATANTVTIADSLVRLFVAMVDYSPPAAVDDTPTYQIPCIEIRPGARFLTRLVKLAGASPNTVDGTNSTKNNVNVGTAYQLGRFVGGTNNTWWYCLVTNTATANTCVQVIAKSSESDAADLYPVIEVGK